MLSSLTRLAIYLNRRMHVVLKWTRKSSPRRPREHALKFCILLDDQCPSDRIVDDGPVAAVGFPALWFDGRLNHVDERACLKSRKEGIARGQQIADIVGARNHHL